MGSDSVLGRAKIPITGDLSQLDKDLSEARGKVGRAVDGIAHLAKGALLGVGAAAAGGFLALGGAIASTIGPASDLNESMSKATVVFGDNADAIKAWSETSDRAMGMSQQQALEAAGTYGNLFRAMGLTGDAASTMSTDMVELAADLGSFNNIPMAEALEKIRAGLTGESEPLKALGINLNEASLKAKALELGLIASTKEALTPAAKAQAAYALILEQSTLAQGDFARTSDGVANRQKIVAAQMENLKSKIGTAFLPIWSMLLGKFSELIDKYGPQITAVFEDIANWVITSLVPAVETLVNWLGTNIPIAIQTVSDFWTGTLQPALEGVWSFIQNNVIPIFQTMAGWFSGEGSSSIGGFADKITTFLAPAIEFAKGLFEKIVSWVQTNWPLIQQTVQTVMEAVGNVVGVVLGVIKGFWDEHGSKILAVVENVWTIIKTIVETVITTVLGIIRTVMQIINGDWAGAWETIKSVLARIWDGIVTVVTTAWDSVQQMLSVALGVLGELWDKAWNGLKEAAANVWTAITGAVGGWIEDLKAAFGRVWDTLVNIGKSIIDGIKQGILDAWDAFKTWLIDKIKDALGALADLLGIGSPSTVMAWYGEQMMAGLAKGIGDGIQVPVRAMLDAGSLVAAAAVEPGRAEPAAGPVTTNQYNLIIHTQAQTEQVIGDFGMMQALARA